MKRRVRAPAPTFRLVRVFSALTAMALAQAPPSMRQPSMFHIEGTIHGPRRSVAPHVNVKFLSEEVSKVVTTDDGGRYSADLPTGLYSMTAVVPQAASARSAPFSPYFRPAFLVNSMTTVSVDGTLYFARPTCDVVVTGKSGESPTKEQMEEATKNLCGGEDLFPAPSADGVPFQIYFRYPKRRQSDQGFVYVSDKIYQTEAPVPVFVAYNIFSLEANEVSFGVRERRLTATGNVVIADGSGKTQHFDSITLMMENGRAVPLH